LRKEPGGQTNRVSKLPPGECRAIRWIPESVESVGDITTGVGYQVSGVVQVSG
jgi:hypothetical protein